MKVSKRKSMRRCTVRKRVGSLLLLFCLLVGVPVYAADTWTLYDDFSSGIINPDKWYGYESGRTGRETQRILASGRLNLSERCYGGTESDVGGTYSEQILRITNSSDIRGIKALVKPVKFETVACDSNTSYTTWVYARLLGRFFNTDPQGSSSSTNDVYAYIQVERDSLSSDPDNTARVIARVRQCIDYNCNYNTLFLKDLGSIQAGQTATLSLEWDKANHRFLFKRGDKRVVFAYDLTDTIPPVFDIKYLSVIAGVPNCTSSPKPTGLMNALFDNVYIKTLSP
jgi:hypothetical protein